MDRWLFAAVALALAFRTPAIAADSALTSISQIRGLNPADAARGQSVRFRAVATFHNAFGDVFVQDSTGGLYVRRNGPPLLPGQLLEIEGRTAAGDYAPIVVAESSAILGEGTPPPAKRLTFDELSSGRHDCEWVEIDGIVRSAQAVGSLRHELAIAFGGGKVAIHVYNAPDLDPRQFIDARVTARGALGGRFNQKRQFVAPLLFVPSTHDLIVHEKPPQDPFEVPTRPVSSLLQFVPGENTGRRVKVRGVVTYHQRGRSLFLRDGSDGLHVLSTDAALLNAGDVVEVLGFAKMGRYTPVLEDATFRRVAAGAAPAPGRSSAKKVLDGNADADLVTLEADLLDIARRGGETTLALQADSIIFHAYIDHTESENPLPNLKAGSRLQLTGIALVDEVTERRSTLRPTSFRLLLRSPADVSIVRQPSWWTPERLSAVIGLLALIALVALFWVWLLRRRVRQQTEIIRQKLEHEAVLEERTRIAREFHDSFEQVLAGIGMQLKAAMATMPEAASESLNILQVTENMVRFSMDEAQRFVWNLRSRDLEKDALPAALERLAKLARNGSNIEVRLTVAGVVRRLPGRIENHLLRIGQIGQEAVTNAAKHARPTAIDVKLAFNADAIRLAIEDNGCGFEPESAACAEAGHFGLLGMRERAEKIGGLLEVTSARERGTKIEIFVPLPGLVCSGEKHYEEENSFTHCR
jgi:signal transduction histidine kinase